MSSDQYSKIGAGFFTVSDGEVLLLLRGEDSGNPFTWGIPGGNLEENEEAIEGALREAREELGQDMPNYTVKGEIRTIRGKRLDKLFTVFVVEISPEDKKNFVPILNDEHVEYRWFSLGNISSVPDLHPVVDLVVNKHHEELINALAS